MEFVAIVILTTTPLLGGSLAKLGSFSRLYFGCALLVIEWFSQRRSLTDIEVTAGLVAPSGA